MKYLPLYYNWIEVGELPENGLCASLGPDSQLLMLSPSGNSWEDFYFWGYDGSGPPPRPNHAKIMNRARAFTPLRQNIMLFLAAMNNEL